MNTAIIIDFKTRKTLKLIETHRDLNNLSLDEAMSEGDAVYAFNLARLIQARFGDNQPEFVTRPSDVSDEPYHNGCAHNLKNSPIMKKMPKLGGWNRPMPFPSVVRDDVSEIGKNTLKGDSDPCAWMDQKYMVTLRHITKRQGRPLIINTRSDLIATDKYMSQLDKKNHVINIFIPKWLDGSDLRDLEPGAPSLERRLKAAGKLRDAGYTVNLVYYDKKTLKVAK